MEENSGSRSSLLWQVGRLLKELKDNYGLVHMPKYLLMENVASVNHIKNKQAFNKWQDQLKELGYESKFYLLNSKDFGSPQNRLRAFLLSVRKDFQQEINFQFSELKPTNTSTYLKTILDTRSAYDCYLDQLNKYQLSEFKTTKSNIIRSSLIGYTKFNSESYVYSPKGFGPTLTATGANSRIKIYTENKRIRTLSNLENFLYMGFTKQDYQKVKNSQLITKQQMTFLCGNSISVQVLEEIFRSLKF